MKIVYFVNGVDIDLIQEKRFDFYYGPKITGLLGYEGSIDAPLIYMGNCGRMEVVEGSLTNNDSVGFVYNPQFNEKTPVESVLDFFRREYRHFTEQDESKARVIVNEERVSELEMIAGILGWGIERGVVVETGVVLAK